MFKNTLDNKRYYTLNYFFKMKFGQKVFKVPLDINSTCPNQINGGCIYCSNKSSATISNNALDILEQFENWSKNGQIVCIFLIFNLALILIMIKI